MTTRCLPAPENAASIFPEIAVSSRHHSCQRSAPGWASMGALARYRISEADREALAIILAQKEKTALLAKALLARETLTKEEVLALFEKQAKQPPQKGDSGFGSNFFAV